MDIAAHLARHATAILVDPVCALPAMIDEGVLAPGDGAPRRA
jgi:tagatose-1,6-bisphosphate aldolase